MMHWLVGTSLQFRYLMAVLAAALLVLGVARLREAPVDVLPEFAPPYVEVQTEALGLSAAEVEQLISLNIEELLSGVPWVQTVRSTSVPGLSSVILIFEPGTNLLRARQLVQERLTLAHMLPNVSKPPVILQPLSATSRVLMVGMTSREVPPIELSVLARWKVRPALMGVPGVANVAIWGQRERQLQVQVDPERLRAQKVSLDQIVSTTGNSLWVSPLTFLNASTPGTGGWIDTPQQRLEVRHVLPISSPADLARVTVEGAALRLGDVARVVENHQPLIGDAVLGDAPGLLFVVEKFPGANTLEVTRGVEAVLADLRPGLGGIRIDAAVFRPATFIELALRNLGTTLLIGAALLLAVLLALLYDVRAALVGLVAVALSLVAAALVLAWRGETLNVMVLAGLLVALGVVIDDAIGDVENIQRRLRERRAAESPRPALAVVQGAALEMRRTGGFSVAVLIAVMVPVFFLQGVAGAFFAPLALSYALALLASLLVALTVTPALGLLLLPGTRRESPLLASLRARYARALGRGVGTPRGVWLAGGLAVLAAALALPFLRGTTLLPAFREPEVLVDWQGPPGQSLPAMTRLTAQVGAELRGLPGVSDFGAHIGRAVLSDQVVGVNAAQLWVGLKPGAAYDRTLADIQATVDGYPGLAHNVGGYLQQTLRQVLTGSGEDLVVRLFGPEFGTLRAKAEEVRAALARIPGVTDLRVERQIQEPSLQIEVNLDKADRYGLKPGDVRRAAATLMNGLEVGSLFEQQKVFEVVVWSTPDTRRSLTDLRELPIDTPRGGYVRLQDVADVRVAPTLAHINREAVSRRLDVSLNVRGRDPGAVARDVNRALAGIAFPLEYHAVLLGEYAERQAAQRRLLTAGLVALVTVFFLLQATLQNWRLAALLCVGLPLALAGGVLTALVVNGPSLSLGLLLGLLAVLGLGVRQAVVLLDHYGQLEREEGEAPGPALARRGAQERLAPILTSALALALALLPFALAGHRPGLEIGHPLAVAALGALVTTTLFNLFVLPGLYLRFGGRRVPDLGLTPGAQGA